MTARARGYELRIRYFRTSNRKHIEINYRINLSIRDDKLAKVN
jgi:hypothetical protein